MIDRDKQKQLQYPLQKQRRCPTCGQVVGGGGQKLKPLPGPGRPRPLPGRPLPGRPLPGRPLPGRPLPGRPRPIPGRSFPEQSIRRTLPWKPKPRPWGKELYERKRREEGRKKMY